MSKPISMLLKELKVKACDEELKGSAYCKNQGACFDCVLNRAIELAERREEKLVKLLEKERYKNVTGIQPINIAFNLGIDTAIEIIKGDEGE